MRQSDHHTLRFFLIAFVLSAHALDLRVAPMEKTLPAARSFSPGEVHILSGPFKQAMDRNADYLLSLDPDRLLHNTRKVAGLEPKGASATISIRWTEQARTLTLGARKGYYPDMPANRIFRVVWMKPGHTENIESTEVRYDGSEITLRVPQG